MKTLPARSGGSAGLRGQIAGLDLMPGSHARIADGPPRPAYRMTYHSHLVYYEVYEQERAVQVLYVWHAARGTRPDLTRQRP